MSEPAKEIATQIHTPDTKVAAKVQVIPSTPNITTPKSYSLPTPVPLPNRENFDTTHFGKFLIQGLPGTGKTILSCTTLPNDWYPAALIDIDGKAADMPELFPLREQGKLMIYQVESPLISADEDLEKRVSEKGVKLSSSPHGVQETVNLINGVIRHNNLVRAGHVEGGIIFKTLIGDSWSRLAEHVGRTVEYIQQVQALGTVPEAGSFGGDWKKFKTILEDLTSRLLKSKMNVIITCHLMERVNMKTNAVTLRPAIEGAFRDMLVSYFNEAYILKTRLMAADAEHTEAWLQYVMETASSGKAVGRTNIKGLPRVIAQNLAPVIRMWRKQMGVEG